MKVHPLLLLGLILFSWAGLYRGALLIAYGVWWPGLPLEVASAAMLVLVMNRRAQSWVSSIFQRGQR